MDLTDDDVREILDLLEALPFDELDLRTARCTLALRRAPGGGWTREFQVLSPARPLGGASPPAPAPSVAAPVFAGRPERARAVRTPLPGTFYRAPRPGAPPFVDVGSHVEEDTVVGIVETMKLMNSVHAGVAGTVVEICVTDTSFARQDAMLMLVDPDVP